MPTYEFACPTGHQFTRFYRKMSDAVAELPCPVCGETATRKISGGAGLLFKGSGFYITDYGKDGKKGMASAKTGESAGGDPAPTGSTSRDAGTSTGGESTGSSTPAASSSKSSTGAAPASSGGTAGSAAKTKKGPKSE